jgi:putative FmdB family regulatory protein
MPAYDYDCAACGRRFEVTHGVHADGPTTCPLCGKGPVRKAITAAAIHYKGSGWAKKERRATATSAASKTSTDGSGPDGGARNDKSDTSGEGSAATPGKAADKTTSTPADGGASATSD